MTDETADVSYFLASSDSDRLQHRDDLGAYRGEFYLPNAGRARKIVRSFQVDAIGSRPKDFQTRSLLETSFRAVPQLVQLHTLVGNGPAWLEASTDRIVADDQKWLLYLRAIHYLHLIKLLTLIDCARSPQERRMLVRMVNCWPMGALFRLARPNLPAGSVRAMDQANKRPRTCRLWSICPFCRCREARRFFDRVCEQRRQDREMNIVSLKMDAWVLRSHQDDAPTYTLSSIQRSKRALERERRAISRIVRARGGGVLLDLVPELPSRPIFDFNSVETCEPRGFKLSARCLFATHANDEELDRVLRSYSIERTSAEPQAIDVSVNWGDVQFVGHNATPSNFRSIIFGGRHEDEQSIGSGRLVYILQPGMFTISPWFDATISQWMTMLDIVSHDRMLQTFGSWHRGVAISRNRGEQRTNETDARLQSLINEHIPIGSVANGFGRTRLHQYLRSLQVQVTERETRRLRELLATRASQLSASGNQ